MSVRKIPPNTQSVTGHIQSDKKRGLVALESMLERNFVQLMEYDPDVKTIDEQPVRIEVPLGRKRLSYYTPDFKIGYHLEADRAPCYVEVKPVEVLLRHWPELHPKLREGHRHAKKEFATFKLFTERDIPPVRLRNIKRLWPHRKSFISKDLIVDIKAALIDGGKTTAAELLRTLSSDEQRREQYLGALWHCWANGIVLFDLESNLVPSSIVWLPE